MTAHAAIGAPSPLFVAVWNQVIAPKTQVFRPVLEELAARALAAVVARVEPGERVLDVGSAWGRSTLALAGKAGPDGHAVGIDCVEAYVRTADREALRVDNVSYIAGDAGAYPFAPGTFDVVASVEGVMFFNQPARAFAHLGASLRAGGRLVMAVPRSEAENPWIGMPKRVARDFLGLPPAGPTCGPGPFSLGARDELERVLDAAGFTHVRCAPIDEPFVLGRTVEATIDMHLELGPVGELVRLHQLDAARVERLRALLSDALTPHLRPAGVTLPGALWLVEARWALS